MKTGNFREVFSVENDRAPLPELPLVGWSRLNRIRLPGLEAHAHPGLFEIFLIERGSVDWWVEKELLRVPVNHFYINRPGERHGSQGTGVKPCGYLWLQLQPEPNHGLPGLTFEASQKILADLSAIRQRSFAASDAARNAFHALWEVHHQRPVLHAEVVLRACLHLLLVQILQSYRETESAAPQPEVGHSFAIAQALRLIELRPTDIVSVAKLAASVRLGVTQFADRFLAETGFTPAHYLRVRRLELAKRLMCEGGHSLTDVAQLSGYSSTQHFATIFKRFEGMTPSEFLVRHKKIVDVAR